MIELAGAFAGQHILITGATGGIGSILAIRLAREGCSISAVGHSEERLEDLREYIESVGGTCGTIVADLSKPICGSSLVESAERAFGPVDSAFLTAGVFTLARLDDLDDQAITSAITLNLISPIEIARALFEAMSPRGQGKIAMTASLAGLVPLPFLSVYSAAKSGLISFCRSAAPEFRERGISLTCIAPGAVDTAFISKIRPIFAKFGWRIDSPHRVAEEILRATALKKNVVVTAGFERLGAYISPLFPEMLERIMRKPRSEFAKIFTDVPK